MAPLDAPGADADTDTIAPAPTAAAAAAARRPRRRTASCAEGGDIPPPPPPPPPTTDTARTEEAADEEEEEEEEDAITPRGPRLAVAPPPQCPAAEEALASAPIIMCLLFVLCGVFDALALRGVECVDVCL